MSLHRVDAAFEVAIQEAAHHERDEVIAVVGQFVQRSSRAAQLGCEVVRAALMSAIGFDLPSTAQQLATRTIVAGVAGGIIVTLFSALLPALKAARMPPSPPSWTSKPNPPVRCGGAAS